ncbi:phytanoyl-CoA dioxygenase family protein [Streptomyces aurantiacus]|uniref:Syringomycin biosynthesis enzyme n=1 Tax=Streptomyces aurantiacus TaxID=47760 RepID=A0A7G1P614_9ACTN|nr:phytanoyl-CoA dioxygenase family protein [Streptomyces aurantiacus]BCL30472.1 syringomycin biosynthesis enzyme [Streptomyces aurantiacus]
MTAPLKDQDVARFHNDGYHFPVPVLTGSEAEETLGAVGRYRKRTAEAGGALARHWDHPKMHLVADWADRLVRDDRLVDIAEQLVGPDVLVWSTSLFTRAARSQDNLTWHQDAPYYGWQGWQGSVVRVWLALTPTTRENGTMRYAPMTHRQGLLPHRFEGTSPAELRRGERTDIAVDDSSAVDVVLTAGQCALHTPATVHCSGASVSEQGRVCFAVDYIAPTVAPTGGPDSALLVRGHDTTGHYELEEPLRTAFGAAEIQRFERATEIRFRRLGAVIRQVRAAAKTAPTVTG